jgi:hypothetical protein
MEIQREKDHKGSFPLGVAPLYLPKGSLLKLLPNREGNEEQVKLILTNTHSYLISILTFTILFFFIKPSLILNSTQLLSLSLFYI